jgi:hypothetical protein
MIPSSTFFFQSFVFFFAWFIWNSSLVEFTLFYFLFASEGAFGSDNLSEYTFEDSDDWDKIGFVFGLSGI